MRTIVLPKDATDQQILTALDEAGYRDFVARFCHFKACESMLVIVKNKALDIELHADEMLKESAKLERP